MAIKVQPLPPYEPDYFPLSFQECFIARQRISEDSATAEARLFGLSAREV